MYEAQYPHFPLHSLFSFFYSSTAPPEPTLRISLTYHVQSVLSKHILMNKTSYTIPPFFFFKFARPTSLTKNG